MNTREIVQMKMKKIIAMGVMMLIIGVGRVFAQDPGDTDIGDPDVPTGIPIDGGISLLFAAGTVLGARKIYLDRKSQKTGSTGYNTEENSIN